MANETKPLPLPTDQEISKPKGFGNFIGAGFVDLLTPEDSVLERIGNVAQYREVLRDDQCASTFQQRRTAVVSKEWDLVPASDSAADKAAAEGIKLMLQELQWDRKVNMMLFALWYGYSVAEMMWGYRDGLIVPVDIKVRRRDRFRWDRDGNLYLIDQIGRPTEMPPQKFWTMNAGADNDDNPYGLGLAHFCYWPVFFKRNGIQFWMIFLEKFGMPTVLGKGLSQGQAMDDTPSGKEYRARLLGALRSIATDAAVLVPEGIEVAMLEAVRSGTTDYSTLCEYMDAAIAKIVLSQTMTTDNGSSKSQAQVHESVADDVVKSDADLLCSTANDTWIKWLTEWNYPGAQPPTLYYQTEPAEDLNVRAERDAAIYGLGYEPDENYITTTYGPGWQKRAQQAAMPFGNTFNDVANEVAQDFAEVGALAVDKASAGRDQSALIAAANALGKKYPALIGPRIEQILAAARDSKDFGEMRIQLQELMAEAAGQPVINAITRTNWAARLLGRLRGQTQQ